VLIFLSRLRWRRRRREEVNGRASALIWSWKRRGVRQFVARLQDEVLWHAVLAAVEARLLGAVALGQFDARLQGEVQWHDVVAASRRDSVNVQPAATATGAWGRWLRWLASTWLMLFGLAMVALVAVASSEPSSSPEHVLNRLVDLLYGRGELPRLVAVTYTGLQPALWLLSTSRSRAQVGHAGASLLPMLPSR
jgi:hypothetical protein